MLSLPWVDYVVMGIVGLSIITGLLRGFVKELIAFCVWVLAIWFGITYSLTMEPCFQPYIHDKTARIAISFVAILLASLLIGAIVNAVLSFILKRSGLSGTDRLLGMGFGFMRGVFIIALLLMIVKMTAVPYQAYTQKSSLVALFEPMANWLNGFMPDLIKQVNAFEQMPEKSMEMSLES